MFLPSIDPKPTCRTPANILCKRGVGPLPVSLDAMTAAVGFSAQLTSTDTASLYLPMIFSGALVLLMVVERVWRAAANGDLNGTALWTVAGAARNFSRIAVPWTFTLGIIALWARTNALKSATSGLVLFDPPGKEESAVQLLPPTPRSLSQAFALGRLSTECSRENFLRKASCSAASLRAARDLLGRDVLPEHLVEMHAYLQLVDDRKSVSDRVLGLLNFVNIIWSGSCSRGLACMCRLTEHTV